MGIEVSDSVHDSVGRPAMSRCSMPLGWWLQNGA